VRVLVLLAVLTAAPALGQQWIDVHMHFVGGVAAKGDFSGAARAAVAAMDEAGIRTAIVMPPPQTTAIRTRYDISQFARALNEHPGRFGFLGGGGSLNVLLHEHADLQADETATRTAFERMARDILAAGAAGFGEISPHHLSLREGHPYEWVAPDHPLLLLLADIAAERDAVIDLHIDIVPHDLKTPARFASKHNPPVLRENLAALERLLAHNRGARIVWAHAGSDPLGFRSPALSRRLLQRHPNLYMSLRFPARAGTAGAHWPVWPAALAFDAAGNISTAWVSLVQEFPDRFVIGGDHFIATPDVPGDGPGLAFSKLSPVQRDMARRFLAALPASVARQVGVENAARLYRLRK
jgi:hypothetical protein